MATSPAPYSRTALHRNDVTGKRMVARAQADVMRFNAPAAGCWINRHLRELPVHIQLDVPPATPHRPRSLPRAFQ